MNHVLLLDEKNCFSGDTTKEYAEQNSLAYTNVPLPDPCTLLNPQFNGSTWVEGPERQVISE
jgi:hypothetical protein